VGKGIPNQIIPILSTEVVGYGLIPPIKLPKTEFRYNSTYRRFCNSNGLFSLLASMIWYITRKRGGGARQA